MVSVAEPQVEKSGNDRAAAAAERAAQRRRRVLMIGQSLPIGADRRSWLQAASLRDAGLQVSVVAPHGESRIAAYPGLADIRLLPYRQLLAPADPAAEKQARRAETFHLARVILREAFETPGFALLSLAQPPAIALPLARLGKLFGKVVVVDYRVPAPEAVREQGGVEDSEGYRAARRLENKLLAVADRVLCPNQAIQEAVLARTAGHDGKLVLVRTGIDPGLAAFGTKPPADTGRHRHHVVYTGPLTAFSGADLFVRAARRIVYGLDRTDILFTLAGSGPEAAAIRDLVVAEGLKDFVRCLPGDDPALITGLLAAADLAVDPSPRGQQGALIFSPPLLDYQLHGIPAVVFGRAALFEAYSVVATAVAQEDGIPGLAQGILVALDSLGPRGAKPAQAIAKSLLWSHDGGPAWLSSVQALLKAEEPSLTAAPAVEAG